MFNLYLSKMGITWTDFANPHLHDLSKRIILCSLKAGNQLLHNPSSLKDIIPSTVGKSFNQFFTNIIY